MSNLIRDARLAMRMLLQNPLFTVIAVIGLGLGIGANSAIFSVVNTILFDPLPYENSEQIVVLMGEHPEIGRFSTSYPDFTDWRDQNKAFAHLAAVYQGSFSLTGDGEPEKVRGSLVSASFFSLLGVNAAVGCACLPEDESSDAERVVVLSNGLWNRRFGANPNQIGQKLILDGEPYTIAGVMPASFQPPVKADLWMRLSINKEMIAKRNARFLNVIGRLKHDVMLEQARLEMDLISRQLEQQYPATNAGRGVSIIPLREQLMGKSQTAVFMLLGAVICVLLIACLNLANLLLAKYSAREKEIGLRIAMGASRFRLIQQLLTESLLLALMGSVLGLLLAFFGRQLLLAMIPINTIDTVKTGLDTRVLIFTFGLALITGLLCGLVPAIRASKGELQPLIKEGGKGSSRGSRHYPIHRLLVSFEVGVALVLLIGVLLMLRSLSALQKVDPGFNTNNLLTMRISLPKTKYSGDEQRIAFYDQLLQRTSSLTGVESVGVVNLLPLDSLHQAVNILVEGRPARSEEINRVGYRVISPDYFHTMGIPFIRGRAFTAADRQGSLKVAIISLTMSQRLWPDEDPVGKRISINGESNTWRSIVGVVGDVKYQGLDAEAESELYLPYMQSPLPAMALALRTDSNASGLVDVVRGEVLSIDQYQAVEGVSTMENIINNSLNRGRSVINILSIFATVALLLALLGIYGVTSYSVSQRTHELGIRMALGAQKSDVLKLILRQSFFVLLAGIALGLGGAFALVKAISSILYGVGATDVFTFLSASFMLIAVGLLASYIPARRAASIDPLITLRRE